MNACGLSKTALAFDLATRVSDLQDFFAISERRSHIRTFSRKHLCFHSK